MKRFIQYLTEKTSREDAMAILGLKSGFSKDDLDKARKDIVRKWHPDVNPGNKEAADKMARANDAYDVLKGSGSTNDRMAGYEKAKQDVEEKARIFEKMTQETMKEHLNLPAFVSHFNKCFTSEKFKVTKEKWADSFESKSYGNKNEIFHVRVEVEFANESRTIVLDMNISADYRELINSRALAGPEAFVSMFIWSEILYNRKKVKLTQNNYKRMDTSNVLSDPETLFPASKLKSQAGKSVGRKLSKRDVLLTFQKELNAHFNDAWVYVPIGEYEVAMWRSVLSHQGTSQAYWSMHSVKGPKRERQSRETFGADYATYLEDAETMTMLFNHLRRLQQHPPATPQLLVSDLNAMTAEMKTKRGY